MSDTTNSQSTTKAKVTPDNNEEEEDVCAICLEAKENPVTIYCGHSFCAKCLDQFGCYNKSQNMEMYCPICRRSLVDGTEKPLDDESPTSDERFNLLLTVMADMTAHNHQRHNVFTPYLALGLASSPRIVDFDSIVNMHCTEDLVSLRDGEEVADEPEDMDLAEVYIEDFMALENEDVVEDDNLDNLHDNLDEDARVITETSSSIIIIDNITTNF